jgi:hypothetical protein
MADSMLQNLLKTPRQIREEQLLKMQQQAAGRAQLGGPIQGAKTALPGIFSSVLQQQRPALATDIAQTARGLTQGLGGMLGAAGYQQAGQALAQATVSPEERQAAQMQKALQGYQPGNLQSMKATYEQLKAANAPPQILMQISEQIQKQEGVVRQQIQAQKAKQSAVTYLQGINPSIAQLVASDSMPVGEAIKMANKALEPITVGKSVIGKKPGTDKYEVLYSAPPEPKSTYRLLTEEQIANNPTLTPGVAYQENEKTGEISAITGDPRNAQVGDYQIRRSYNENGVLSVSMEVIPGSATDKAQKEANRKTGLGLQSRGDKVDLMDRAISKSIDLLKNDPEIAQWQGALVRVLGRKTGDVIGAGSKTAVLDTLLTTIKANIGFDKLQDMRDESPTGGALGQVAIQELIALQSSIAPLDPKQGPTELTANLEYILETYRTNMEKLANSYSDAVLRQYGMENAIQFRTQDEKGNPLPDEGSAPADPLGIRR